MIKSKTVRITNNEHKLIKLLRSNNLPLPQIIMMLGNLKCEYELLNINHTLDFEDKIKSLHNLIEILQDIKVD